MFMIDERQVLTSLFRRYIRGEQIFYSEESSDIAMTALYLATPEHGKMRAKDFSRWAYEYSLYTATGASDFIYAFAFAYYAKKEINKEAKIFIYADDENHNELKTVVCLTCEDGTEVYFDVASGIKTEEGRHPLPKVLDSVEFKKEYLQQYPINMFVDVFGRDNYRSLNYLLSFGKKD